jgi:hypothetical protein
MNLSRFLPASLSLCDISVSSFFAIANAFYSFPNYDAKFFIMREAKISIRKFPSDLFFLPN